MPCVVGVSCATFEPCRSSLGKFGSAARVTRATQSPQRAPSTTMSLKMMDFFRKIPADLTETTVTGAALSVAACLFMGVLFVVELYAFLSTTVETGVMLDTNTDSLLRINFNVTMLDLQCEYAAVDVVDVLGTNSMNVTKNVEKWQLDEHGKRMIFQGRNREQKAISYEEHHPDTVEEMIANGIHVRIQRLPAPRVDGMSGHTIDATRFAFYIFSVVRTGRSFSGGQLRPVRE